MNKKQIKPPQREKGSSQKNSLVCRQCGKPIKMLRQHLDNPAVDTYIYDICIDCFIERHNYDHRQKKLDFNFE